ncbi:MAG: EF-P lysine aminoacylase EpmA [Steroidobacteraceae bacterium]|jgi:lysyl-tRNA synthetase class 2|nr:EF-P lysine aminoacylase EpmA [Steroidobacteraceae bacterium]
MTAQGWRPTAGIAALARRAELLARVRAFFAARGVLEVETPVLARATVTDVHLASLETRIAGRPAPYYLQTSPEYAMKRLLAAGAPDLYQVCKVFRDGEVGSRHNPEFTMVEWYRHGFDDVRLMHEVGDLLHVLIGERLSDRPEFVTYRGAFERELDLDPYATPVAQLRAAAERRLGPVPAALADDRDACLDLLMGAVVGPALGRDRVTFVHDYPATQAALARLKPGTANPPVAARFEAYVDGLELCNGFHELVDASEQRRRFEHDLAARTARGLPAAPVDERLLAALAHGLPDCAGVALGFDRVAMLALHTRDIRDVIAFPVDEA